MTVIHNPVVTPELLAWASGPVDHPWFAEGEPPVVLSAGRLTRQKDHETLLRAFALMRQSGPAEIPQGGSFGLLAAVGDPRSLAEARCRALGRPHAPAILWQHAMEFTSERAVGRYLDIMLP